MTSRMTKEVQHAGGNATNQNQYIGPPRELTVDTSNQELRLHDGVTPGGHRFPNRDSNDQRYQAKSSELDGFNGRTEEHTSELQSIMRNSYAVFCWEKKT